MVDAVARPFILTPWAIELLTKYGPFASDTVTNALFNGSTNLSLEQPTSFWTNKFVYDAARRLTNVTSPAGSFASTVGATAPGSRTD